MLEPHVQLLGENAAVVSHVYDADYVGQNGERTNYDGALTYVFHRKDGKWRIVHIHESAQCNE